MIDTIASSLKKGKVGKLPNFSVNSADISVSVLVKDLSVVAMHTHTGSTI